MQTRRIRFASDHSLLVSFEDTVSLEVQRRITHFTHRLLQRQRNEILNVHPAYCTVLISFDPLKGSPLDLKNRIAQELEEASTITPFESRAVEIPVCYDEEFGLDLRFVADHNRLSTDEVIQLHSSGQYVVYFLGFSPGFPYLGGMPKRIAAPRLSSPRKHVSAGSVAIGGNQTGIYSVDSPGGWRIVGKTPVRLFDPLAHPPTYLQMGDTIRFKPIARPEFDRLAGRTDISVPPVGQ